ncbi:hypothetical protein PFAG_02551 [Plasmodium falciparum Santa Lucia]|uniref:High molecular weight rhoptry protein 2 n=1 Tax=Plasmodium falciparum Santa Lucia TaxID=478859 RepID=W7FJR1_PLAFA|nr:hypothetical protein PFAG_02551 [Plasmodium falciparum Santa Lucia]
MIKVTIFLLLSIFSFNLYGLELNEKVSIKYGAEQGVGSADSNTKLCSDILKYLYMDEYLSEGDKATFEKKCHNVIGNIRNTFSNKNTIKEGNEFLMSILHMKSLYGNNNNNNAGSESDVTLKSLYLSLKGSQNTEGESEVPSDDEINKTIMNFVKFNKYLLDNSNDVKKVHDFLVLTSQSNENLLPNKEKLFEQIVDQIKYFDEYFFASGGKIKVKKGYLKYNFLDIYKQPVCSAYLHLCSRYYESVSIYIRLKKVFNGIPAFLDKNCRKVKGEEFKKLMDMELKHNHIVERFDKYIISDDLYYVNMKVFDLKNVDKIQVSKIDDINNLNIYEHKETMHLSAKNLSRYIDIKKELNDEKAYKQLMSAIRKYVTTLTKADSDITYFVKQLDDEEIERFFFIESHIDIARLKPKDFFFMKQSLPIIDHVYHKDLKTLKKNCTLLTDFMKINKNSQNYSLTHTEEMIKILGLLTVTLWAKEGKKSVYYDDDVSLYRKLMVSCVFNGGETIQEKLANNIEKSCDISQYGIKSKNLKDMIDINLSIHKWNPAEIEKLAYSFVLSCKMQKLMYKPMNVEKLPLEDYYKLSLAPDMVKTYHCYKLGKQAAELLESIILKKKFVRFRVTDAIDVYDFFYIKKVLSSRIKKEYNEFLQDKRAFEKKELETILNNSPFSEEQTMKLINSYECHWFTSYENFRILWMHASMSRNFLLKNNDQLTFLETQVAKIVEIINLSLEVDKSPDSLDFSIPMNFFNHKNGYHVMNDDKLKLLTSYEYIDSIANNYFFLSEYKNDVFRTGNNFKLYFNLPNIYSLAYQLFNELAININVITNVPLKKYLKYNASYAYFTLMNMIGKNHDIYSKGSRFVYASYILGLDFTETSKKLWFDLLYAYDKFGWFYIHPNEVINSINKTDFVRHVLGNLGTGTYLKNFFSELWQNIRFLFKSKLKIRDMEYFSGDISQMNLLDYYSPMVHSESHCQEKMQVLFITLRDSKEENRSEIAQKVKSAYYQCKLDYSKNHHSDFIHRIHPNDFLNNKVYVLKQPYYLMSNVPLNNPKKVSRLFVTEGTLEYLLLDKINIPECFGPCTKLHFNKVVIKESKQRIYDMTINNALVPEIQPYNRRKYMTIYINEAYIKNIVSDALTSEEIKRHDIQKGNIKICMGKSTYLTEPILTEEHFNLTHKPVYDFSSVKHNLKVFHMKNEHLVSEDPNDDCFINYPLATINLDISDPYKEISEDLIKNLYILKSS